MGAIRTKLGYVGDIAILGIGSNLTEAAATAQREVDRILRWTNENVVSFDYGKSEAVCFVRTRTRVPELPKVRAGSREIQSANEIQWLGVFLD